MVEINVYRNKNGDICKYTITGHANAAKHGEDHEDLPKHTVGDW